MGYQDQSGFHYGKEPDPRLIPQKSQSSTAPLLTDRAKDAMKHRVELPIGPEPETTPQPTEAPDRVAKQ